VAINPEEEPTMRHLPEIKRWAEREGAGADRVAVIAQEILGILAQLEQLAGPAHSPEEAHLSNRLADLTFEVARAHGMSPQEFFREPTAEDRRPQAVT
jgi:hypothetical protein